MDATYPGTGVPKIVSSTVLAVALVILGVLAYLQVGAFLKNEAVNTCLKNSAFETQFTTADQKKITTTEPIKNWYDTCMKEKGYK